MISSPYFFDTSALIHRYLDGPSSTKIRRIVSSQRTRCYISELTVLEMSSAIARRLRRDQLGHREFDRLESKFFKDIAEGFIEVYPLTPKDYNRARGLLRYAGMVKRRRLTSVDALIACAGLDLAYREGKRVIFCTSDQPLFSIIGDINAFTSALDLRYYDPPLQPAPATMPITPP